MRSPRVLVVGNYCHDVLFQDGIFEGESVGGASTFVTKVLDGMSVSCTVISKVGTDFKYTVRHDPIVVQASKTTTFHADLGLKPHDVRFHDRILRRVYGCDPIRPSELPCSRFEFGMAVGVGGEIPPETLERMIEICDVVIADIQALIRVFDSVDGLVKLDNLHETRYYPLLKGISILKSSSEEVAFMDVDEVRKQCCVVVTEGSHGCRLYGREREVEILPFSAQQVDPTGAGDSFLGGLVTGLVHKMALPDAALLGNFFGSLTVEQLGPPDLCTKFLEIVMEEIQRRKHLHDPCVRSHLELDLLKPSGHNKFHTFLAEVKALSTAHFKEKIAASVEPSARLCCWNEDLTETYPG